MLCAEWPRSLRRLPYALDTRQPRHRPVTGWSLPDRARGVLLVMHAQGAGRLRDRGLIVTGLDAGGWGRRWSGSGANHELPGVPGRQCLEHRYLEPARLSSSPQWLASMAAATTKLHPDFGGPPYGFPYNVVDNSHATVPVTFQYASESDPGPYPVGFDTSIENGSDHHALIINRDTCSLYELFDTSGSGSSWTAGSGAVFNLGSNALRPLGWTSADAAGLPLFPGLVRWDEVQAGAINHAIRLTAQQTDKSFLWPARHQPGTASSSLLPPMGARFRLQASYDVSHFSPQAQVILRAMQHYGLILADNGSNWFFSGTEDAAWPDSLLSELKTVPASRFEAVDESSLMVDANSAAVSTACPAASGSPQTKYSIKV